jgi:hypothetical protein
VLAWAYGAFRLWRRGLVGVSFVVFPFVFLVGISASQLLQAAEPFYYLRYVLPAQVFIVVMLAVGTASAVGWGWQHRRVAWAPAYAVGVVIVVLGSLARLPRAVAEQADRFAWNCQNIEELNVAMALWLRDNVPAGEAIAVNDAGASRYFGEHPIIDFVGLNHHGVLHREPGAMAALARVGWVSAFPSLIPSRVRDDPAWTAAHRTSTDNLTICRCPQSEIVTYRRSSQPP